MFGTGPESGPGGEGGWGDCQSFLRFRYGYGVYVCQTKRYSDVPFLVAGVLLLSVCLFLVFFRLETSKSF